MTTFSSPGDPVALEWFLGLGLFFFWAIPVEEVDNIAIISHLPGMVSLSFDGYPVGLIHPWRRQRHFTTWLCLPC